MKDKDIHPGEFHGGLDDDVEVDLSWDPPKVDWSSKYPAVSNELVAQYAVFSERFGVPKRVFYPCSHLDISPISGFPDSEVLIIERDSDVAGVMKREGIEQFVHGDALTHEASTPYDLAIILNPSVNAVGLTKNLGSRGFVMANNYHNSTSQLIESGGFEPRGTIYLGDFAYCFVNDIDRLEPRQWDHNFYVLRKN